MATSLEESEKLDQIMKIHANTGLCEPVGHLAYIHRTACHCISLVAHTLHCHFITFDWKFTQARKHAGIQATLTELEQ